MLKTILSTFFTRFFIALSNLVLAVILSNYLGASGRGEQSLIITLISFIIIITSLIGTSALSYLIPRYPFSALLSLSYLWVSVIILVCFLILPFLDLVPSIYTADICILSFLLSLLNIHITVLIAHQKINAVNFLNFFQSLMIILALMTAFTLFNKKSISSYIIALYTGYGITLTISIFFVRGFFRNFRLESLSTWIEVLKKLFILGTFNQVAVFTQLLSFRLSYYILNFYYGKEAVGIYSNAVAVAESIWLIGRSIGTVQHSRIVNSHDAGFSLNLTSRLNRINLVLSLAMIIILVWIPGSWYVFLFGNEFININFIIQTLSPGIVFFGVALILGYYFSSTGKHFVNAIASSTGLIITIILGMVLIPAHGNSGAGITASLSYASTALVVILFYIREKRKYHLLPK